MKYEKLIPIEVVVTQKHLDEGYHSNPGKLGAFQHDPVALALVDAGIHEARVELSTFYRATFPDAVYKLPEKAQRIVLAYLDGRTVRVPQKFTVRVPESWRDAPAPAPEFPVPDGFQQKILTAIEGLKKRLEEREPQEKWYLDRRGGVASRRKSQCGTPMLGQRHHRGRRKSDLDLYKTLPVSPPREKEPQKKWYQDRRGGVASRRKSQCGTPARLRRWGRCRRKYDRELIVTLPA
jgi:hypothetical protein